VKTVWKFPIPDAFDFSLRLPEGAKILAAAEQHGGYALWALVEPTMPRERRAFRLFGTGQPIPDGPGEPQLLHVATFLAGEPSGRLVWHLFEEIEFRWQTAKGES
jgi:hypothetical protein